MSFWEELVVLKKKNPNKQYPICIRHINNIWHFEGTSWDKSLTLPELCLIQDYVEVRFVIYSTIFNTFKTSWWPKKKPKPKTNNEGCVLRQWIKFIAAF